MPTEVRERTSELSICFYVIFKNTGQFKPVFFGCRMPDAGRVFRRFSIEFSTAVATAM